MFRVSTCVLKEHVREANSLACACKLQKVIDKGRSKKSIVVLIAKTEVLSEILPFLGSSNS